MRVSVTCLLLVLLDLVSLNLQAEKRWVDIPRCEKRYSLEDSLVLRGDLRYGLIGTHLSNE